MFAGKQNPNHKMLTIDIRGEIISGYEQGLRSAAGDTSLSTSADDVRQALDAAQDERDIMLDIDCMGGDVYEGFKIYDLLRNSGKTLHACIRGGCHSMATVVLLAAPLENRTGVPNLRALVHLPRTLIDSEALTADQSAAIAENLRQEQEAMLDVYADRTGRPREDLERLMAQERYLTANEMIHWGFISRKIPYNTNFSKTLSMKKNPISALAARIAAMRTRASVRTVAYDFEDVDGRKVFRTDKESDELSVGDRVEMLTEEDGGIFTLRDGRVITIDDGVVTKIDRLEDGREETVALLDLIDGVLDRLDAIETANADALASVQAALEQNARDLRAMQGSSYTVASRLGNGTAAVATKQGKEALNIQETMFHNADCIGKRFNGLVLLMFKVYYFFFNEKVQLFFDFFS